MYSSRLTQATLIKRYKRFLVDLENEHGEVFTVHCANTGKMTGCADSGFTAFYSTSDNPKRKYPHSLELTRNFAGDYICVNTAAANRVVEAALKDDLIHELQGYAIHQREVNYGSENSKIDFLLTGHKQLPNCYLEVKSTTLLENGQGYFPDTQTARGQKHIRELIEIKQQGFRAVLLFAVMHTGIKSVKAAAHIDEKYAQLISKAIEQGVEVYAYKADITLHNIRLSKKLSFIHP